MQLFELMGLFSTIALSVPVVVLLVTRLAWYKSFPALFIYSITLVSYNFFQLHYLQADKNFMHVHGLINNYLGIPLILLFLSYFSKTALFRKRLIGVAIGFVLFEIVLTIIFGFNRRTTIILMGPGLLGIVTLCVIFFVHQVKITVVYQKAIGKMLMTASLLFAYGGYSFIYIVFYLMNSPLQQDFHLIFFLITIFSSLLLSAGVIIERRRVKQLEELKTTRAELRAIYGEEDLNEALPFETVVFRFDKNQQN